MATSSHANIPTFKKEKSAEVLLRLTYVELGLHNPSGPFKSEPKWDFFVCLFVSHTMLS